MTNPYQQPKPRRDETVAKERFYPADWKGHRISSSGQVWLLAERYLWIDATLTIPLASILKLETTAGGGVIRYVDDEGRIELEFYFMCLGLFGSRRDKVTRFIRAVEQQRKCVLAGLADITGAGNA